MVEGNLHFLILLDKFKFVEIICEKKTDYPIDSPFCVLFEFINTMSLKE